MADDPEGGRMTGFLDLLSNFHFIRPLWLLLVPIALVLWWRIRILRYLLPGE